ncbi:unnamed protein product [Calicophoron daubneyi]|uniref:Uncharacterized protein n=1 Tax=Calicophoron daubneyi TaxID=300641 RepID=A0AAV2T3H8_CALDB
MRVRRMMVSTILLIIFSVAEFTGSVKTCSGPGERCSWTPEEFCCEPSKYYCVHDVCKKCRELGDKCLNSNECCMGVCFNLQCSSYESVWEWAKRKGERDKENPNLYYLDDPAEAKDYLT